VNGQVKQSADVSDLIHGVPAVIAHLSGFYHLRPGDLIYTGTPEGVGAIRPGDRLEGSIEGVGRSRWRSARPARSISGSSWFISRERLSGSATVTPHPPDGINEFVRRELREEARGPGGQSVSPDSIVVDHGGDQDDLGLRIRLPYLTADVQPLRFGRFTSTTDTTGSSRAAASATSLPSAITPTTSQSNERTRTNAFTTPG
jgi:hypothetical protein